MKVTDPVAAPKDKVKSNPPELRGSFSNSIDYARLRRRSAAASTSRHSPLDANLGSRASVSTMDVRSSASDSSHEMPCWPHCDQTTEQGGLKSDPRGRCYSPCSTSPAHSPSKHFKFCFSDPKTDCMDGCHRRVKYRRRQHRNPHTRLHKHTQRHPDCVRFNASGPVPRQGLISFQYISKLFQPWLWRPSKRTTPRTPDVSSSHDDLGDDADSGMFIVVVALLVLILIGVAIYMSQDRDVWNNMSFELNSPSKVLGFENYLKNEVIDEMGEKAACADCKTGTKVDKPPPPPESDSSGVGLEKYLRKKANRIINKLN